MATWICEKDHEDFKQEQKIKGWLNSKQLPADAIDFKHISRKGRARNTLVRASVHLDQKISEDPSGTFADLIAGSDGRDLYCGEAVKPGIVIDAYLSCLGFNEEDSEWIIKMLMLSEKQNKLRSKLLRISLELLKP